MPKTGQTVAQANRALRQEATREWLSKKCTAQHLVDNLKKIEGLNPESDTFKNELDKYKEANAQRIKLLGYYLPALKGVEVSGEGGGQLVVNLTDYKK